MVCFLFVERNANSRWCFQIYSSALSRKALESVKAHICIKSEGGNCFAAQVNVLPLMSMTKIEGINSGNLLVVFDEQLKKGPNQAKVFDYIVKISTTPEFRAALNHNDEAGTLAKYKANVLNCNPRSGQSLASILANIMDENGESISSTETNVPSPGPSPQSPVIVTIASDDEAPVLSHENLARGRRPRLWRQARNANDHDYAMPNPVEEN